MFILIPNVFGAKSECFISLTLAPAQKKVFKKDGYEDNKQTLLEFCQTDQLIKESRYWVGQKVRLHFNSNELFGQPSIVCLSMLDTQSTGFLTN